MSIPVTLADLAKAAGLSRADPSTLPLDIVRLAFAGPDGGATRSAGRRAAIQQALETARRQRRSSSLAAQSEDLARARASRGSARRSSRGRDLQPPRHGAPLSRPAGARPGDAGVDRGQSRRARHPLEASRQRPRPSRAASIFAADRWSRPGTRPSEVWEVIVGASPREAAGFVGKLIASRDGRMAAFYDAVSPSRRRSPAIRAGRARRPESDPQRAHAGRRGDARERSVASRGTPVHAGGHRRLGAVPRDRARRARGADRPADAIWAGLFGESGEAGPVDAAWLATAILNTGGAAARHRLETFLFAQRALAGDSSADPAIVTAALRDFSRYPALMLTLETNGVRTAAAYAAAGRAAAALGGDEEAVAIFQASLAIVDRARASDTLTAASAQRLIGSLVAAATARPARAALLAWLKGDLLSALTPPAGSVRGGPSTRKHWSCTRWPARPRTRRCRSSGKASATGSISRNRNRAA